MIYAPDGYATIREKMQPGDVIAFGGKSHFSEVIKWATRSSVSHVGVILQTVRRDLASSDGPGYFNQIIESTTINDLPLGVARRDRDEGRSSRHYRAR